MPEAEIMADATNKINGTEAGPVSEDKPEEIFKRMVINDKKQNQKLSANLSKSKGKDGQRTNVRFIVCTLGLLALSVSQMSRMILNQTIKDMVDPVMLKQHDVSSSASSSSDDSCPWPEEKSDRDTVSATTYDPVLWIMTSERPTEAYQPSEDPVVDFISNEDDERPVEDSPAQDHVFELQTESDEGSTEDSTIAENSIVESSTGDSSIAGSSTIETIHEDKFKWTMKQQSYLLGGFFYGYSFFMIPGGRLAEIYGAKYVVLLSIAGSGIINAATPWMARNNFTLLLCSRALLGIIQSGVFPAMYALFAKWLTATETSLYAPLIKLNLRLGMFFGSILPGILADWPSVFYFTGIVCAILSVLWFLVASSDPVDNSWVSESELAHINRKKRKPIQEDTSEAIEMTTRTIENEEHSREVKVKFKPPVEKTPWVKILTNSSVIGLILVKVTFNYAVDFFSILIPSYLAYVHHASKETVSLITTIMFSLQIALIVFIGWLAKVMIIKKPFGLSKTAIRKIFQSVANWGMAISLILVTFNDCNIMYVAVLLQLMSLLSMFTAGGETMLPYDLSDQYPATIMAIANSVANFSGVTTTYLAGAILGNQSGSYSRWNILMYLIAGANLLGGLAFVLLVKAEPIDFTKSKHRGDIEQQGGRPHISAPPDITVSASSEPTVAVAGDAIKSSQMQDEQAKVNSTTTTKHESSE